MKEEAEKWANDYLDNLDKFIAEFLFNEQLELENNILMGFDKDLFKYKRFIVAYENFKNKTT